MAAKRVAFFRPPRLDEDIPAMVADMRAGDRAELEATIDLPIQDQLKQAIEWSTLPVAAVNERGDLLALFGAAPFSLMSKTAAPWMVGTNLIRRYPKALTEGAQRFFAMTLQTHPRLLNFVDARNTESVKWLARLGFTVEKPKPHGIADLPFHRFHMGF